MNDLLEMLTYRRPAGGLTEHEFRERFILVDPRAKMDDYKNIVLEVGEGSTTLFSCHTDTVHKEEGIQGVVADASLGVAYKTDGFPLGADNAAGVWILLNLIKAGVPGVYVFHHGEEKGGIGSGDKTHNEPEFFKRFKRAIAFDRRGEQDVITHQRFERCCSQTFALALSAALNAAGQGFQYRPDDTGSFTDTANMTELIPECTNVSVGYMLEHSKDETLDLVHVTRLLEAALLIDWEALPAERDPTKKAPEWVDGLEERADALLEYYEWNPRDLAGYAAELEVEIDNQAFELDQMQSELSELRRWRKEAGGSKRGKRKRGGNYPGPVDFPGTYAGPSTAMDTEDFAEPRLSPDSAAAWRDYCMDRHANDNYAG
jgi:hypothetical protein